MGQRQPVAKVGKFTIVSRPDYQVPMVRQQAVSQQTQAGHVLQGLPENAFKGGVIGLLTKQRPAAIAPIEHMVHVTTQRQPMRSRHGGQSTVARAGLSRIKGS